MSNTTPANRLIHAASPYLLQHAHNPVDWFEWGNEALTKARTEDKPILVSIGYSSCHWCHVMERESFENEAIAQIMNEHFVCIKVDREERPDIDHLYMEAVHAMQQRGGWPLNVFLTPEQKPFYGGTYFPPKNWSQLLIQINKAFQQKRTEINQSALDFSQHLQTSDLQRFSQDPALGKFSTASLDAMFGILRSRFDTVWGGMDKAPKFVMPSIWLFLLRYHAITRNQDALEMVSLTLNKMAMGGLYDQLGGGFSRYSVDAEWFAPHFEKMLYDNAQLLSLYAEAYTLTKDERFKIVIDDTVSWLGREMKHPEGGFYSALDADSEGMEGKFYTWTWDELTTLLTPHDVTSEYFNATPIGNWEHGRNILIRSDNDQQFMSDFNINKHDLDILVKAGKEKLLTVRNQRVRPGLDDKVLTGWNAMTIHGLLDAYKAMGDHKFLQLAIQCMLFLETRLMENGKIYRAFKNKHSDTEGFLEDYAWMVQACTSLYEVTFDEEWLTKATRWTDYILKNFYDPTEGFFEYASTTAEKLIAKKKEIFDNVIPSSNAVMARNLNQLGILLNNKEWRTIATNMAARLSSLITSEPSYMCHWGILYSEITHGMTEVVIVGTEVEKRRQELHRHYLPFAYLLGTEDKSKLPLFEGRESKDGKTWMHVCYNMTCELPTDQTMEAIQLIENRH